MTNEKITGILLAGGRSSRMGYDKALIKLGHYRVIELVARTMHVVCDQIILSANSTDYDFLGLQRVSDEVKNIGPIAGLHASLKHCSSNKALVVSCDVPFVSVDLLTHLIEKAESDDTTILMHRQKKHPLIAIYRKSILPHLETAIKQKKYKLLNVIAQSKHSEIQIDRKLAFYDENLFLNLNTPEELALAQTFIEKLNR